MSEFCTGVIPPLTTPFDADGALNLHHFEANLESYLEYPLAGFLVLGSTGEAIHLDRAERLQLVRSAASIMPSDRLLLVGVAEPSARHAVSFVRDMEGVEVHGVLVSTPHYYRNHTSVQGLRTFFETIADSSPYPVILYNFPQCTGVELAPDLVGELATHANIVGIKDSSGNVVYLQKILRATDRSNFQVISGSAEIVRPAWDLGVRAGIYAAACVAPELCLELVSAWQGEAVDVDRLQGRLFVLSSTIVGGAGIPGIKYAVDQRGWRGGCPRLPFLPLSDEGRLRVDSVMETAAVSR